MKRVEKQVVAYSVRRYSLGIELLLFLVAPLSVFILWPELWVYRYVALSISLVYFGFLTKSHRWDRSDLGIRLVSWNLLWRMGWQSVAAAGLLLVLDWMKPSVFMIPELFAILADYSLTVIFAAYVLVSVPLQELVFRSLVIKRLQLVSSNHVVVALLSAFVFGAVHLPFSSQPFFFTTSSLLGYWYAIHYLRSKSIVPVVISHAIIGSALLWAAAG